MRTAEGGMGTTARGRPGSERRSEGKGRRVQTREARREHQLDGRQTEPVLRFQENKLSPSSQSSLHVHPTANIFQFRESKS